MRKVVAILIIFTISFLPLGFSFKTSSIVKVKPTEAIENSEKPISNLYLDLDKLPEDYNHELAIKNGDVVGLHGLGYNVYKLDDFIEGFKNNTLTLGDMVRVTRYTIEGDPVIFDLIISDDGSSLVIDHTRGKFISPADKKRVYYKVKDIFIKRENKRTYYKIITDTGEELPIATFKDGYF
ncbi:DUF4362 domain-containing protein [Clostridium sp.]|uniref:DUF4362 domain-containing protein n=1 Tax=Clostridium sp. TaxID=1506 RepID=UPI002FC998A6